MRPALPVLARLGCATALLGLAARSSLSEPNPIRISAEPIRPTRAVEVAAAEAPAPAPAPAPPAAPPMTASGG